MPRRIAILDTTLRDGEKAPGFCMSLDEKLEVARQLARLGVDVIEAGYPAASPGDFASVKEIARVVRGPDDREPRAGGRRGNRRGLGGREGRGAAEDPRGPRHLASRHEARARDGAEGSSST